MVILKQNAVRVRLTGGASMDRMARRAHGPCHDPSAIRLDCWNVARSAIAEQCLRTALALSRLDATNAISGRVPIYRALRVAIFRSAD
jgi:hypothetical protein